MEFIRQVVAYKNYFLDFYYSQPDKVQRKIEWTLNYFRVNEVLPEKFFKHVEDVKGIYEIRIEYEGNIYRIFSFFDKGNLIILGNAFQKKSMKLPKKEIEKAIKIMEEYFHEKTK